MKERTRVLITGGTGLLAVSWAFYNNKNFSITSLLHKRKILLDGVKFISAQINSPAKCIKLIEKFRPEIIIHTAGLSNVEICESNPISARHLNVEIAYNIATACSKKGVRLVHISTDHLFSGKYPYSSETDLTKPLNNYAKSKFEGEEEVLRAYRDSLIVRTNFFGWGTDYRTSFSDLIINSLRNNKDIGLFSDVFFTPISIKELSKAVHELLNKNISGVYNIVGSERLSKYDFGIQIAMCFNLDKHLIKKININSQNLVIRPKDMSLSNEKLLKIIDYKIPDLSCQLIDLRDDELNFPTIGEI